MALSFAQNVKSQLKHRIWKTFMSNDEQILEMEFLKKFAAEGDVDQTTAEEDPIDLPDPEDSEEENNLDETLPEEDAGAELPDMDSDQAEMQMVKDLIPWDSFVIIFDPHYAKTLQDNLSLPEPKSKSKSFYIYFSPENKRLEGIVNKRYVGGFGEKESLGEDFEFLKSLSPEGFPPDWKDKLLTDIDEMPAVENSKVKEELKMKQQEEEEDAEVDVEVEEKPEEEGTGDLGGEEEPEVETPKPIGKVDTSKMTASRKYFNKISSREI
jgi:hypothetical protein